MITAADVGGVHIKYLFHCPRQLWLFARGFRPESLNATVQLGEAVHETTYTRQSPIDLGAARLDFLDGEHWVHEVKSASRSTPADEAQAIHYCYRLHEAGVPAKGAILHYPKTRRTRRLEYGPAEEERARTDIAHAVHVMTASTAPPRLDRPRCRGCSYLDYCWNT